jgi:hypothetical protein
LLHFTYIACFTLLIFVLFIVFPLLILTITIKNCTQQCCNSKALVNVIHVL